MLEFLAKRIGQLVDSLLEPIWKKVLDSSWKLRALLLIVLLPVAYLLYSPKSAFVLLKTASALVRVGLSDSSRIPLSPQIQNKTREIAARLAISLDASLDTSNDSWILAQQTLALCRRGKNLKLATDTIVSKFDLNCKCWWKAENRSTSPILIVSGWVLTAFACSGQPAKEEMIDYLLREQRPDGWWGAYPVESESSYASTYSTAWALLGLHAQRGNVLTNVSLAQRVDLSLKKASSWLLAQRATGSRWRDYPQNPLGKTSVSISALALHALHSTLSDQLDEIDSDWLEALPSKAPTVTDNDQNLIWIFIREDAKHERKEEDSFVQVQLPWMLVATAEAYPNGTLLQRARALEWIEEALSQSSVRASDTLPDNWWKSELLYALDFLTA
jgi:hypothetical protein